MTAVRADRELVLAGPPRYLTAPVDVEIEARVVPVAVRLKDGPSVQRAHLRAMGPGRSEMRVRLPHGTPPGRYAGEAVLEETRWPLVLHVAPLIDVRIQPDVTRVAAEPGGRAEFTVSAVNGGNVAVEVPESTAIDLDSEEQERALGRALRADLSEGERRVDRFFEELRESHGGEGRVVVEEGSGALEPGESRELRCRLEVPMTARPGHSYTGSWEVGNAGHFLTLEVGKPAAGTPRTRGRRKS